MLWHLWQRLKNCKLSHWRTLSWVSIRCENIKRNVELLKNYQSQWLYFQAFSQEWYFYCPLNSLSKMMQSRKNCISKIFLQTDMKCFCKCIAWNNAKSNHSKTSPNYPRSHQKFPKACIWVIFSCWASPNTFSLCCCVSWSLKFICSTCITYNHVNMLLVSR